MNISIGSYQAKTTLPELLRHDKQASIDKLKAFMQAAPVRGVDIKALIERGRIMSFVFDHLMVNDCAK